MTAALELKTRMNSLSSLQKRILTALVLIPPVLIAIWIGSPYVDVLILLILVCMTREWSRMVLGYVASPFGWGMVAAVLALLYTDMSVNTISLGLLGCLCASLGSHIYLRQRWRDFLIHLLGSFYISGALYFLIYLSHEGLHLFFMWLMVIIWSSDTGAYFAGRFLQGPKLAPTISPNKTWAGFWGGIIAAMIGGYTLAPYLQNLYVDPLQILCVCAFLSFVGHMGDLLESLVKRYYGVKDSGNILPGHGGMLDRFDSLLFVTFAAGLLLFFGI